MFSNSGLSHGAVVMTSVVFAVYMPTCSSPKIAPTVPPEESHIAQLWQRPDDLASRDLFYGPRREKLAADAQATYTSVSEKVSLQSSAA